MTALVKPLAATVLVLSTAVSAGGWYLTAHKGEQRHFESCREQADGTLILGYEYGAGDEVAALFEPTKSALIVSLLVDSDSGDNPAIALHGELRLDTAGGLDGRPVRHEDGTVLSCSEHA